MKTFVRRADIVEIPATRAVNAGDGHLSGSLFGVSLNTTASGATGQFLARGEADVPMTASQAVTVGEKMYWDNTGFLATTSSASGANQLIGVATVAIASSASLCRILLGAV